MRAPLQTGGKERAGHVTFTWRLGLFFIFNAIAVNALIWAAAPEGFQNTALSESWDVLRGVGGDDSWGPMAAALAHLEQTDGKPLYSAVFFDQGIKFQYPPSALFALEAMLLFGEDRVRTYDEMTFAGLPPVNDLAGWAFLMIIGVASALLLEAGLRRSGVANRFDGAAAIRALLVLAFTLTFYPAAKAFTLGQIQLWINALFALAMVAFVIGGKWTSGILLGVACLMKPHYGLLAIWAGINREWRFAYGCVLAGVIGLVLSVWHYGWMNHLDYLRVLSFMSERGESYHANQSVNGLLNRLASLSGSGDFANAQFDAYGFPPFTPWVYWGTLISSIVMLLGAFLHRTDERTRVVAFALVAASLTIASPIAWEHHYGLLFPVYAFLAGTLAGYSLRLAILAISYIFVSNFIAAFNLLAQTPYNILQSTTLMGGLILLFITHFHFSRMKLEK